MHKTVYLLFAALSFGMLTACAAQDDRAGAAASTPAPQPSAAGPGDTLARIHALVGTPSCSADSQCKSLPLGARPCGGPESYVAYSSARTSEPELRALAEQYQAERHAANARSGMASTCLARMDPGAVCQAGTCVLGAPAPAAPVAR